AARSRRLAHHDPDMAGDVGTTPAGASEPDGDTHRSIAPRAEDGERRMLAHPAVAGDALRRRPYAQRALDPVEGEGVFVRSPERHQVTREQASTVGDRIVGAWSGGRIDLTCFDVDRRGGLRQRADLARAEVVDSGDVA